MDKKTNDFDNIEYTIVMDPEYPLTEGMKEGRIPESAKTVKKETGDATDILYAEYERMCLKEPTVLDKDDIYPHTYQWRIVRKDDPAKIALVRKALEQGVKIADTDEYQEFLEDVKKRGLGPDAWE